MKRLLLLVVGCLLFTTLVNAQAEYKPFRVDLGVGLCSAFSDKYGTFGAMLYLEPKYAVIQQLSVGFKYEANILWRNFKAKNYSFVQDINSYQATADYHFKQKSKLRRTFVGAGLGIYQIEVTDKMTTNNFGVMFRTGFDIAHFRLMFAYNLAGKDKLKNNAGFASVNIGTYFGGGKKKSNL